MYFLDCLTLEAERLVPSFERFVEDEFLRNCREPYDELLVAARNKLGELTAGEHIAQVPSPLITGCESLDHVVKMPATAAMIANGDLASQLANQLQARPIKAIESYLDAERRPRLRVVWADPPVTSEPS